MKDENVMTEDERAVRLLEPLRGEPAGPSRIDLPRAMAEGRRRRWSRRWSAGVLVTAVTTLATGGGTLAVQALHVAPQPHPVPSALVTTVTAQPAGPVDCTVHALPTAGGGQGLVTGGDPSGHYLVGRNRSKSDPRTLLWQDGRLIGKMAVPGGLAEITDINSAGTGVGDGYGAGDGQKAHAYVLRDGALSRLRGGPAAARAINDAGVIVGQVGYLEQAAPARWASTGAAPTRLPLPRGATVGETDGIDEDGTIVGGVGTPTTETSGHLWFPNGSHRPMPLPTVDGKKANYFWPDSISNGWVTGRAVFDTAQKRSFVALRYHIATDTYEKLPVTMWSMRAAPNGWVAGVGSDGPVILAGSHIVRLPKYGKARDYVMTSLSADGRTVAGYTTGVEDPGGNVPLEWTCH